MKRILAYIHKSTHILQRAVSYTELNFIAFGVDLYDHTSVE